MVRNEHSYRIAGRFLAYLGIAPTLAKPFGLKQLAYLRKPLRCPRAVPCSSIANDDRHLRYRSLDSPLYMTKHNVLNNAAQSTQHAIRSSPLFEARRYRRNELFKNSEVSVVRDQVSGQLPDPLEAPGRMLLPRHE